MGNGSHQFRCSNHRGKVFEAPGRFSCSWLKSCLWLFNGVIRRRKATCDNRFSSDPTYWEDIILGANSMQRENRHERTTRIRAWVVLFLAAALSTPADAAAPARSRVYAESICSTNSNVFFCEDFEGQDLVNYGGNNCNSTWGNPAIAQKDICWAGGGSHQRSTINLPGFNQSTNRVWRISKSQSFTDINTGINTGTGNGTLAGWLNSSILGSGAREWYTRMQVYFSSNHVWPADYDFKMFFALPRTFVDPPSAA